MEYLFLQIYIKGKMFKEIGYFLNKDINKKLFDIENSERIFCIYI